MRVNVYAEEMTDNVEIVQKGGFTGVRFWLYLPISVQDESGEITHNVSGPFMHHFDDDDSSAITFWGKTQLRKSLKLALRLLDKTEETKKDA